FALGTQGLLTVFREPGNLAADTASHEQMQQELGVAFDVWSAATLRREQPQLRDRCAGAILAQLDAHVDPGALGQALAELIAGAPPHVDPAPYAPDRFTRR
ncbi:MAG: FAD-binding oxidoreductase, partial [Myxococcales bacterium]|nr:FAD-binding oxidoreductase [Myxococcales bacterium]